MAAEAEFNDDNSRYVGSWHYPDSTGDDADEQIIYSRVEFAEQLRV